MSITPVIKDYVDHGTGPNQIVATDGSSKLPSIDGSQLTGVSGVDINARNNLAINFFNDSVNDAIDRVALENGWIDQLEDLSDIDNGAVEIPMVRFDGANDWIKATDATLGQTSGKDFTLAFWIDLSNSTDGTTIKFISTKYEHFSFQRNPTTDRIQVNLQNNDVPAGTSTTIATVSSTNAITASDGLVHIMFAINLGNTTQADRVQMAINGVVETNIDIFAPANDVADSEDVEFSIGGNTAGGQLHNIDLGQFWFAEEYIDLDVAANMALFYDGTTNPVDLGSDGSKPTGTAPLIYLNNPVATWQNNLGSGGNFTENGQLVDAGTLTIGASDLSYNSTNDNVTNAHEIIDSYGKENGDNTRTIGINGAPGIRRKAGQALNLASASVIYGVAFEINKTASPTGNAFAEIHGVSGTVGSSGLGDDNIIARSIALDVSTLTTTLGVHLFVFPEPVVLASGDYVFCVDFSDSSGTNDGTNYINYRRDESSGSHAGNGCEYENIDGAWTAQSTHDAVFYLYGLKNLDMITVGSDVIGNSPSVAPTTGHLQVILNEQPAAGSTQWSDTLDTDEAGKQNVSFRQVIDTTDLSSDGSRVRFRLEGPAATEACEIDNVAIVERSGETSNGVTTPTEILFGGASGVTIPIGGSVISDWLDFELDSSKDYLLIVDMGATAGSDTVRKITSGGNGYYEQASANTYNTAAGPTGSLTASSTIIFNRLEIETQQTLDTDIVGQISRDGGSTWDTVALARTAIQVAGTNMNILQGECTFAATTGTNIVGRIKTANKDKITVHGISPNWS